MPRLEFAVICSAAAEGKGGTLSRLDVGIDNMVVPGPASLVPVTFVFKIRWFDHELQLEHQLKVAIDPEDQDAGRLGEFTMLTTPERRPEHHPTLPLSTQLVVRMPLQVQVEGMHTVALTVDDAPVAITPFIVTFQS